MDPQITGSAGLQVSGITPGTTETTTSHVGQGPRGYKRSDDRVLEDVCERLTQDPTVDARRISVEVADGVATLTGEVANRQMKRMAEDIAFSVWGVEDVSDQIRIAPPEKSSHSI